MNRDFGHALDAFERVLDLDPDNYLGLGYIARIRGGEQFKTKAIAVLSDQIKAHPDFPDLQNEMGKLLMGFGNYEEARGYFAKAIQENPGYVDAHINLSLALGELGRNDEAIARLLDIQEKNVKVFYLLGNFFYKSNRLFEAMTAYTRVSEINPHYCDTDEQLESLRDYFAKINNLLEMHRRLAQDSPNYPDIHVKLGSLYLLVGNPDEALKEFVEAVRLKPDYQEALEKIEYIKSEKDRQIGQLLEEGKMSEQTFSAVGLSNPAKSSPVSPVKVSTQEQQSV
jgi:tetratricopeptide (TPR) repeat protein